MDMLKQRKCRYCRRYRCRCDNDSRLNNTIKATKVSEETFNRDKVDAETDLENVGPLAAAVGGAVAGSIASKALGEEFDITQKDMDNMRGDLEDEITDMMADILNKYGVGASSNSFYMHLVNEGLEKIFEAMIGYVEGTDLTIEP